MADNDALFLDTGEAAELLRLSRRTLERLRLIGGGPRFRAHGKRRLYSRADLFAWSEANARRSTSETKP